jgi:hypothetical protein
MASDGDYLWPSTIYGFAKELKAYGKKSPLEWEAVSDFNGGMFVVWSDSIDKLEAVHIDHQGNELWRTDDIYSYLSSVNPVLTPDGFGGIIVSWLKGSHSLGWYVMTQRLNLEGKPQWNKNPIGTFAVEVSGPDYSSKPFEMVPLICSDNTGGAIIVSKMGLYHVDGDGKIANSISNLDPGTSLESRRVVITSDGPAIVYPKRFDRGVYAAWPGKLKGEIYAQKYHASNLKWPKAILVTKDAWNLRFDYNESFEMLIGWINQSRTKISAQKLDIKGKEQWPQGGIVVADSLVDGYSPYIIADRKGGIILVWVDSRNGKPDLYAQRIDSSGIKQWESGGNLISKNIWNAGIPNYQRNAISTISDGSGGVLIAYQAKSSSYYASWNIVIVRLSSNGNEVLSKKFDSDAFSISPAYDQQYPKILFDHYGPDPLGAIVIFDDDQEGLCAQKIAMSK